MSTTDRRVPNPLAVALDTADLDHLERLAASLAGEVGMLKVGLEAFMAHGPEALARATHHAPVFADLKLHDIPATVAGAARAVATHGVRMLTVHAAAGPAAVAAAVEAAPGVDILGVTVLTSLDDRSADALGWLPAAEQVPRLAFAAMAAGARGLICAVSEIALLRAELGDEPLLVVPGIRPEGFAADDQARVGTPSAALEAGADYLVVGRPITQAADPVTAARALLRETAA